MRPIIVAIISIYYCRLLSNAIANDDKHRLNMLLAKPAQYIFNCHELGCLPSDCTVQSSVDHQLPYYLFRAVT